MNLIPEIAFRVLFSADVRKQPESRISFVFRFPELRQDGEDATMSESWPPMVHDTTQNGAAVVRVKL